jgi:CDP-4-dehydro-6-deoxyglucose reductase, E3
MPAPSFSARLVSVRDLTPTVRELAFEKEDGPLVHEPGQWLNLDIPREGDTPLTRAYSIASAPTTSTRFELAVTRVATGPGSQILHTLVPGLCLSASGPNGFFTRPVTEGVPSLFVGTGTGITPLRSMVVAATRAGAKEPLTMLIGVRSEADMLYADELATIAEAHPNVRVRYTLSQPSDAWQGLRGYVQEHVPHLVKEIDEMGQGEAHVYICGLEKMVKGVREIARKQLSLPRERVHSERYD